jgi:hypothetical protein
MHSVALVFGSFFSRSMPHHPAGESISIDLSLLTSQKQFVLAQAN